jgi:hypothetical protein
MRYPRRTIPDSSEEAHARYVIYRVLGRSKSSGVKTCASARGIREAAGMGEGESNYLTCLEFWANFPGTLYLTSQACNALGELTESLGFQPTSEEVPFLCH